MKFFIMTSLLFLTFFPFLRVQNEFPDLSKKCREKIESRDSQYNNEVIMEIITSFQLESRIKNSYRVTLRDLEVAHQIYGNNPEDSYYQSLAKHFLVSSKGEPHLFIHANSAILLYKNPSDKNVMIELRLKDRKWIELERKEIQGEKIPFKVLKCEKEYHNKRLEYEKS